MCKVQPQPLLCTSAIVLGFWNPSLRGTLHDAGSSVKWRAISPILTNRLGDFDDGTTYHRRKAQTATGRAIQ
jgi:hypothetical protein